MLKQTPRRLSVLLDNVKSYHGSIIMSCHDSGSFRVCRKRYNHRLSAVEILRLVILAVKRSNSSVLQSSNNHAAVEPNHARNRRWLWEFIANDFLIAPVFAELVNINDVVALSNGKPCRIRTECEATYDVRCPARRWIAGFCREFVLPFAILVENQNCPVSCGDCELLTAR